MINPKKCMKGHLIGDKTSKAIYSFHPINSSTQSSYCIICSVPRNGKLCNARSTQSKCNEGRSGVFFRKFQKEKTK